MRIERHLDSLASAALHDALGVDAPALLKPTQDAKHGDFQINGVLPLAKQLKKSPRELAERVAGKLAGREEIASAEVAGPGFVNLRLSDAWLAARLTEMVKDRERDGVPAAEPARTIVVDYSSPNIAKQMHVGHLRSTIIGDALVRMLRFLGHRVIADNHLGDWGTQFGLLIVGMREWGSQEALSSDPIVELERVYKLASARAETDAAFAAQARAELAKLQAGDAENRALWQRFVDVTRASLDAIYDRLGVRFDVWLGESFYDPMLPGVVELLLERGLAREDQGAICVFWAELEGAPAKLKKQKEPFIIRKSDGAYLYSTSDIATVLYRRKEWSADEAIYVVDSRQGGHFEQLFAILELLGEPMALEHVGFGMVLGEDGKPKKTRDVSGKVETLAMLLDEAEARAEAKMIAELDLPADMARSLAPAVGIGAVKYADLVQNRLSNYQFSWEKLIAFDGDAGPYLQFAHARASSIFRKGELDRASIAGPIVLEDPTEKALGRKLVRFGDVVHQASEQRYPHFIAEHVYSLCKEYSRFLESCRVLDSQGPTRESRIALVDLTARQIRRGLSLLGIDAPERM